MSQPRPFDSEGRSVPVPLPPPGLRLEELERWYVLDTLKRAEANRTRAAPECWSSLRGLRYRLPPCVCSTEDLERDIEPAGGALRPPQWRIALIIAMILSSIIVLARALGLI